MSASVEDNDHLRAATALDNTTHLDNGTLRDNAVVRPMSRHEPHQAPAEHSDLSPPAVDAGASASARPPRSHHDHHDHHVLIDADEDRWAWRRKIRQNPRQLIFYRMAVALVGLLLIACGFVTGPLPGPGGIPLVLLGLAIWSSEFEWAHRLMVVFKRQLHRFRGWSRGKQILFWVIFFTCCGALAYAYLLTLGFPFWMPEFGEELLQRLPGI